MNRKTGYVTVAINTDDGWVRPYVHRVVCAAFNPVEGWEKLQCDHKDSNKTNNYASNLRFVTRQFNNSRKHAKLMRMKNKKRTDHSSEYVKAYNPVNGEIRYFKNGNQVALAFGCSAPLVYMALDGKTPTCYGWKLEWIPDSAPEVKAFHAEVRRMAEVKKQKKRNSHRMWYAKKRGDAYRPHKTYRGKPLPAIELN